MWSRYQLYDRAGLDGRGLIPSSNTFAIALIVFQLRVVTGTPKTLSKLLR
jgi:hypothetical protein